MSRGAEDQIKFLATELAAARKRENEQDVMMERIRQEITKVKSATARSQHFGTF